MQQKIYRQVGFQFGKGEKVGPPCEGYSASADESKSPPVNW